ncbi:ceramidase [Roridomyces roridus]|uniref:Ceramidase n=1 Tax=Roridomyces roridus TaxID=1738132 RepID=A0AAD7F9K8_9AGAR|nr:ceramidase [Roridomyces roridus]
MAILNYYSPLSRPGFHGAVTSTIDWCEANYQFSYYVAEMANSFSNLVTVGFAVWGFYLAVAESLPKRLRLGFAGIALVGLGSFYFHATLRFEAQLVDELPMIWVTSTAIWLLFDQDPGFTSMSTRTRLLTVAAVVFNVSFSWSYYINRNPVYHQVVFGMLLLLIAGRIRYLLVHSALGKRIPAEKKRTIGTIFSLGVAQFLLAFLIWNLDNIFCETLTRWKVSIGWPAAFLLEGHSWWHVASGTYFKFAGIHDYIKLTCINRSLCVKDDHRNFAIQYRMGLPYVKRVDRRI